MDWSKEEKRILFETWAKTHEEDAEVLAIATRAVELAAARGGTMTAKRMPDHKRDGLLGFIEAGHTLSEEQASAMLAEMDRARECESAQGARLALLEAERREIAAALGSHDEPGLVAVAESLQERLSAAEEGNRELVRRAQQAEAQVERLATARDSWKKAHDSLQARCTTLSAAGQVLSAHVDKECPTCADAECAVHPTSQWTKPERYPCSPTCTHDDAKTPGHPERVKERSEAVKTELLDPEACEHNVHFRDTCGDCEYDRGAEAMRAACWEAVRSALADEGWTDKDATWRRFKSAIEGAVS